MGFHQERYVQPRTREIERIFQENQADIKADIQSLELSFRDLAKKYKVNDHNIRRWAERLGIDPDARTKNRKAANRDGYKCKPRRKRQADEVASPKLLSMKW